MNLFVESWDYLDTTTQRFAITGAEVPKVIAGGRRNTLCCGADTVNGWGVYVVSGEGNTLIVGAAVAFPTASGLGNIFSIGDQTASGYSNVDIRGFDDGSVGVYRYPNTLLALSPVNVLRLDGVYQYVEAKVLIASGSAGAVEVRVNGQPVITLAATNTFNSGSLVPKALTIWPQGRRRYDDLYINTGVGLYNYDFEGDVRIDTHYVNADGDTAQWNRNTGSTQFGTVDEHPPDEDVTYNSTPTVGAIDTINLEDLIPVLAGVRAVHYLIRARAINLPTVSGVMHPILRIGGTNYLGPAFTTTTSGYRYYPTIYETSPATGIIFADAEFDGMQVGYKFG